MKTILLSAMLFAGMVLTAAQNQSLNPAQASLYFVENKGQVTDQYYQQRRDIQYKLVAGHGLNIFIGTGAIHYQFARPVSATQVCPPDARTFTPDEKQAAGQLSMYRMDVSLIGADPHAVVTTEHLLPYYENHITSATGTRGTIAHAYCKISYKDIYPKIDWILYIRDGKLEHEFVVHAGGKPSDIHIRYSGATGLHVNEDGSLTATTPEGEITEHAPVSYAAQGVLVPSAFSVKGNTISYQTGRYDGELTIDPTLVWSSYYGGAGQDWGYCVATDAAGNGYFGGYTDGAGAIVTAGAYQDTLRGMRDAVLTKVDSTGRLLWATYFGGNDQDDIRSIGVDSGAQYLYVAGKTGSTSGIATPGAVQDTLGGNYSDGFLAKFTTGGQLIWATYAGGTGTEDASSLTLDGMGHIYIAGTTSSTSGMATPSAYQTAGIGLSAWLARYDTDGRPLWCTYVGGESVDIGSGVATDGSHVYIGGYTTSTTGIANNGTQYLGAYDGFIAQFDTSGGLNWSTYVGGSAADRILAIAARMGYVVATGYTESTAGIATAGTQQPIFGGNRDGFLIRYTAAGVRQWGTYYGGTGADEMEAVTTTASGDAYIAGAATSTAGMAGPGAYDSTFNGVGDAILARYDQTGHRLWGTYLGGPANDYSSGIAVDPNNNVFTTGIASSTAGISTYGSYQATYGGGQWDGFIARFGTCIRPYAGTISGPSVIPCRGDTIVLSASVAGGTWKTKNRLATVSAGGAVTSSTDGTDTVLYIVANGCATDTAIWPVTINRLAPYIIAQGDTVFCAGDSVVLSANYPVASSYVWFRNNSSLTGVHSNTYVARQSGYYFFTYSDSNHCFGVSRSLVVVSHPLPVPVINVRRDSTICFGDSVRLSSSTGVSYLWTNNATTQQITVATSGLYTVALTDTNGCTGISPVTRIKVDSVPTVITVYGQDTFCMGDSVTLGTTPTVSYLWSTGATSRFITVYQAGTYSVVVTDTNRCHSQIHSQTLWTKPLPTPVLIQTGSVLSTTAPGSYEWYDGPYQVFGATQSSYTPTHSGTYYVLVVENGCHASSNSIDYVSTGLNMPATHRAIKLWPNPTQSTILITSDEAIGNIKISDVTGRIVYEDKVEADQTEVDLLHCAAGMYYVYIGDRIYKLIKD